MSRGKFYLIGFVALIVFDTFSQICFKMAALQGEPFQVEVGSFPSINARNASASTTPWTPSPADQCPIHTPGASPTPM